MGVLSVFIDAHPPSAELCHRKDDKQGNHDCELHLFHLLYDGVNALKLHFSVCNSSKEITHQVEVSRDKIFLKKLKNFSPFIPNKKRQSLPIEALSKSLFNPFNLSIYSTLTLQ